MFLALATLTATMLHAQDTTTVAPQGRKMTVQLANSLIIGPDPFTFGADLRVFIPINSLRGLRVIPSLGMTTLSALTDNGTYVPFTFRVDLAYSFLRFAGRNGGLYGKMGPAYDIQLGVNGGESQNALGLDLGMGIQGNVGLFDIYFEVGRIFSDFRRNEIIIGTTYTR